MEQREDLEESGDLAHQESAKIKHMLLLAESQLGKSYFSMSSCFKFVKEDAKKQIAQSDIEEIADLKANLEIANEELTKARDQIEIFKTNQLEVDDTISRLR